MLLVSGFWALGEWTGVFYGISFIIVGISWLYQNKKNREKFEKTHLKMIYNTKKNRKKFRNANLLAISFILMGIIFFIMGLIYINNNQVYYD